MDSEQRHSQFKMVLEPEDTLLKEVSILVFDYPIPCCNRCYVYLILTIFLIFCSTAEEPCSTFEGLFCSGVEEKMMTEDLVLSDDAFNEIYLSQITNQKIFKVCKLLELKHSISRAFSASELRTKLSLTWMGTHFPTMLGWGKKNETDTILWRLWYFKDKWI